MKRQHVMIAFKAMGMNCLGDQGVLVAGVSPPGVSGVGLGRSLIDFLLLPGPLAGGTSDDLDAGPSGGGGVVSQPARPLKETAAANNPVMANR